MHQPDTPASLESDQHEQQSVGVEWSPADKECRDNHHQHLDHNLPTLIVQSKIVKSLNNSNVHVVHLLLIVWVIFCSQDRVDSCYSFEFFGL